MSGHGEACLAKSLQDLVLLAPRRSMIFLLSDRMEEPESGASLRALSVQNHQVRVVHQYSKVEWDFDNMAAQFVSTKNR